MAAPIATEFTQNLMVSHPDIQKFLEELAASEAYHVRTDVSNLRHDAAVSCGISLVRPGRAITVASSDTFAEQLDEVQYDVDEGPCLQALHTGVAQLGADLDAETRWPRYREAVQSLGLRSVMGLPLPLEHGARAAMNVYSTTPNAFDDVTVEAATTLANQAARAVVLAIRVAYRSENTENLQAVLESRRTTDVAVGILMARQRFTQEAAFETLRSAAISRNVSLHEVAAGLVNSVDDLPQS